MTDPKPKKDKKAVQLTTKEALRRLFPPSVVEEAKKVAHEQRKDK